MICTLPEASTLRPGLGFSLGVGAGHLEPDVVKCCAYKLFNELTMIQNQKTAVGVGHVMLTQD